MSFLRVLILILFTDNLTVRKDLITHCLDYAAAIKRLTTLNKLRQEDGRKSFVLTFDYNKYINVKYILDW